MKSTITKSKQKQYIKWKQPQQKEQTNKQTNKNQSTTKQMNKTKQILQQQIPDQKVAGHGKMFFSKVNVLCWLLFQYLFHPCVNVAARKKIPVILPKA